MPHRRAAAPSHRASASPPSGDALLTPAGAPPAPGVVLGHHAQIRLLQGGADHLTGVGAGGRLPSALLQRVQQV